MSFARSELATGEYNTGISITTTDTRGNSATYTDTLVVDTVAPVSDVAAVTGDDLINRVEASSGLTLNGSGEPGSSISVEFQGVTRTATVGANGSWSVDYASSEIRTGTYNDTISVTSTDSAGNSAVIQHNVSVDTENGVTLDGPIAQDNVVNAAEASSGVTLTGTAQPGSSVTVELEGVTRQVTASANGSWSASFAAGEIRTGEYDADITVVAVDPSGNRDETSGTVRIDTTTDVTLAPGFAGGDQIINAAEAGSDLSFSGTAEPGSTVNVTIGGVTRPATVFANGKWSATFEAGALPAGEYDTSVTVVSTDAAGNTAQASSAIRVDTVAGDVALSPAPIELDDVINAVERADGVDISGSATPGLTVTVGLGTASRQVVADANGNWSTTFPAADIPVGTQSLPITASITDAAGNSRQVSDTVDLDTRVDNHAFSVGSIEGDNVINFNERGDGVNFTGTTEPGSTVAVSFGSSTKQAVVDANGNWSVNFSSGEVPTGTYDANVTAVATDPAGNVNTVRTPVRVDTEVQNYAVDLTQAGDDLLNAAEHGNGVTLTGTTEPGATVSVEVEGVTRQAVVDGSGNWTVTFQPTDLPEGTYAATANIVATDAVGNTSHLSDTFQVDTEIDTPNVDSVTFSGTAVRRFSTDNVTDNFEVGTLAPDGTVDDPAHTQSVDPVFGTEFTFASPVPDGTHLVVQSSDAAGNESGTLVVLQDNATNATNIENAGIASYDIQGLNLDYAADTNLTLNEAQILALSGTSDIVQVQGGADDTLTLANATKAPQPQVIDGQTYNVYTVGNSGAVVVVDQEVNVII